MLQIDYLHAAWMGHLLDYGVEYWWYDGLRRLLVHHRCEKCRMTGGFGQIDKIVSMSFQAANLPVDMRREVSDCPECFIRPPAGWQIV